MTIKPEVLAALDQAFAWTGGEPTFRHLETIRAELLAMDAEIVRLRKIEEERWSVVATRNAAVMRAEKAEALLRDIQEGKHLRSSFMMWRITSHLSNT